MKFNFSNVVFIFLILFGIAIICAFVYLSIDKEDQTEVVKRGDKLLEETNNPNLTTNKPITADNPSSQAPAESITPTADNPEDNNIHGSKIDFEKLTIDDHKEIYNQFYKQFGLEVPPNGYTYLWKEPGIPEVDVNGKPILHKRGEPIIEIEVAKAFTPTFEEYKMLKTIEIEMGWQEHQGNTGKANELKAQYNELYESVQRERPALNGWIWAAPKADKESDPDKPRRIAAEKLKNELIKNGYSYLIPILEAEGEL